MQATCDKCSDTFTVKFQEKKLDGGIKETYFTCSKCGAHYTSFVTDKKVRQLQQEIRTKKTGRVQMQRKINRRMTRLKNELLERRGESSARQT